MRWLSAAGWSQSLSVSESQPGLLLAVRRVGNSMSRIGPWARPGWACRLPWLKATCHHSLGQARRPRPQVMGVLCRSLKANRTCRVARRNHTSGTMHGMPNPEATSPGSAERRLGMTQGPRKLHRVRDLEQDRNKVGCSGDTAGGLGDSRLQDWQKNLTLSRGSRGEEGRDA